MNKKFIFYCRAGPESKAGAEADLKDLSSGNTVYRQ